MNDCRTLWRPRALWEPRTLRGPQISNCSLLKFLIWKNMVLFWIKFHALPFGIFSIVLKYFQINRNLPTLTCLWGLSGSTLTNLKETNVWKRILIWEGTIWKRRCKKLRKKNLESSWVSHVKIHFIFCSDLNGSYCRINWKIKIDIKIGKKRRLVKYRLIDLY